MRPADLFPLFPGKPVSRYSKTRHGWDYFTLTHFVCQGKIYTKGGKCASCPSQWPKNVENKRIGEFADILRNRRRDLF